MTAAEYSRPKFAENVRIFAFGFSDEVVTMRVHAQLMAVVVLNLQKHVFSAYKAFFFELQSDRLVSQRIEDNSSNFQERSFWLRIFEAKIVRNLLEICPL